MSPSGILFSCPQSFPASGSFLMSWLSASAPLGSSHSVLWGAALCLVGFLGASLASTQLMPLTLALPFKWTTKRISRHCQMPPGDKCPPSGNHSSKGTASYLSLGEGSEACFGSCRISLSKEGRFTAQPPHVMEVGIMSANKFIFILEHFINTRWGKAIFKKYL